MSGIGMLGEISAIEVFRREGYEVYIPFKDIGIDFLALKNNKVFRLQVKTSKFQKGKYFWFDLYKSKLVFQESVFYFFVFYHGERRTFLGSKKNFLCVPSMQIQDWISQNKLPSKKGNNDVINFFVYPDFKNKVLLFKNKSSILDLTSFHNQLPKF